MFSNMVQYNTVALMSNHIPVQWFAAFSEKSLTKSALFMMKLMNQTLMVGQLWFSKMNQMSQNLDYHQPLWSELSLMKQTEPRVLSQGLAFKMFCWWWAWPWCSQCSRYCFFVVFNCFSVCCHPAMHSPEWYQRVGPTKKKRKYDNTSRRSQAEAKGVKKEGKNPTRTPRNDSVPFWILRKHFLVLFFLLRNTHGRIPISKITILCTVFRLFQR